VNYYGVTGYGLETTIKFRAFNLPSCIVKKFRCDNRPLAQLMYAGRMSFESGDDLTLREKYAQEFLNMAGSMKCDNN
jgi:hypothetical protein